MVSPSLLSANFIDLKSDIEMINKSEADWLHLDVMDGIFVPNISFGFPVIEAVSKVCTKPLDVHFMIQHPENYIEQTAKLGAMMMNVHYEACTHLHRAIQQIHAAGCKAGVALNPATSPECLRYVIGDIDLALVMTVNPGFGGQKFMADQMPKVAAIRKLINERNPACELEVDGGVAPDTCQTCIDAGANVLVAGSAVYKAEDIPARIKELRGK